MRQEYFVFTAEVPIEKVRRFEKFCEQEEIFLVVRNQFKLINIKEK